MNYQKILEEIRQETEYLSKEGAQATYIPELGNVNPDKFGICLTTLKGKEYCLGDSDERFSIQSISKVLSLAMALGKIGKKVWERVGVEPSGNAFNSIFLLEMEKGRPRNPLINAGALVVSDIILSEFPNAEESYLSFVKELCGGAEVSYNEAIASSEQSTGYLNAAIANMLKYHGNINNKVEDVLHFYFRQGSLMMSCRELCGAFSHFANHAEPFDVGGIQLTTSQIKRMNAVMLTCGFYDEAGEFSYKVGLPGKSGVGGGIAAICPNQYSVAVWSPRLNPKGNSVVGMKALELLTDKTGVSIF